VLINSLRINDQHMGNRLDAGHLLRNSWLLAGICEAPKLCNGQSNCYFMWHHHNKRITTKAKGILSVHLRIYISSGTHVTKFPEQSYGKLRTSNWAKGKRKGRILTGPSCSCHWDDALGTLNPTCAARLPGKSYFLA